MANLGVKPAEVLATLNGQNKTTYTGYYDNGDNRIRVTVNDKFKTVEDIGKMLIQGHDDDQLRLSDIAQIEKGYEEPTRNEMYYDGERALGILIAATSGSDIVKVGHAVEVRLAELKLERLPAGVEYQKVFYQPERVGESLGTFVINLIESVIIVVLILMIAMGFKSGVIIGISLVVTVFGSFLFLYCHYRWDIGRSESREGPDGGNDRHRAADCHAIAGSYTDRHHRFLADLYVAGYGRCLYA